MIHFTPEERAEAARLYREGLSLSQLSARYGKSGVGVLRMLRREGVTLRPQGSWSGPRKQRSKPALIKRSLTGSATLAAQNFRQPTLIDLPPHLQAAFEAELAKVKAERAWL